MPGEACLRPVYEEFDVAEMSLSWYAMARSRNEPVYALPIFPMRMFAQPYIYCGPIRGSSSPADLIGKRSAWTATGSRSVGGARGILQEHYGVRPRSFIGLRVIRKARASGAARKCRADATGEDPSNAAQWRGRCADLAQRPESYRAGDPRIRRLFEPAPTAVEQRFRRHRNFPDHPHRGGPRRAAGARAVDCRQPRRCLRGRRRFLPEAIRLSKADVLSDPD